MATIKIPDDEYVKLRQYCDDEGIRFVDFVRDAFEDAMMPEVPAQSTIDAPCQKSRNIKLYDLSGPSHYSKNSVASGLHRFQFAHLSKGDKKKLVRLMARISECSFRRGFQHGVELSQRCMVVDPAHLRFFVSLARSPYTHAFTEKGKWVSTSGYSSKERLLMEYGVLLDLFGHGLGT